MGQLQGFYCLCLLQKYEISIILLQELLQQAHMSCWISSGTVWKTYV